MNIELPGAAQLVGAALEIVLALWVFAVAPRSPVNRAFALFLYALGLADASGAAGLISSEGSTTQASFYAAGAVGYVVAAVALVWFALVYPGDRRMSTGEQAVLAGLGVLAATTIVMGRLGLQDARFIHGEAILAAAVISAQGGAAWWLSRHIGRGDARRQESTRLIVMGIALWPLYTTASVGTWTILGSWPERFWPPLSAVYVPLCALAIPAAWRLARKTPQGQHRWGQIALLAVAFLAGLPAALNESLNTAGYAGTIIGTVALVTYGVLRHDLFTLDGKVRFAISKSTVAALFVAVFFIATEGAQVAFGQGEEWVGLLAGGALVFALAPLQRAADRLAEKAVPSTPLAPQSGAAPRREEAYRDAIRLALRAGVTRREEFALARLARELQIDAHRALQLRDEVETSLTG